MPAPAPAPRPVPTRAGLGAGPSPSARPLGRPLAGDLTGDDVEPVPGVDRCDDDDQCGEARPLVVPGRLLEDLVRHRVGPVGKTGPGFGQRERGALCLVEVRGLSPGGQGGEPLVGLTGLLGSTGVHVEADRAAVDLAGPHAHQVEGRLGQTGLGCRVGRFPAESLQGIHDTGHGEDWAADPRFHGVSLPSIEPYALSDTWRRRNVTSKARLVGGHIGTGSGVIVVVTRD